MNTELLTAADVAKMLRVCTNTARDLIRTLPHIKVGSRYRVRRDVIEKYIEKEEKHGLLSTARR